MGQPTDIDATDLAILRELQRDARLQNKELASIVGVAPSTALERVRSLRRRGVLTGFHATVSLAALGRPISALLSVRVRPHRQRVVEEFKAFVLEQPETVSLLHVAGPDDYLIQVAVPDTTHLQQLLIARLLNRSEVVSVNTMLVFEAITSPVQTPTP
ncbi:Lrp/AsnC family transcriptional regulator [Actinokineospora globicatena]|uniref:AsnC family transcriptional regulator n=1 Tax=Actinokineospora globicatena TaxID=103729 RepID=A0A9W6VE83_9PSEU|nr:Lrp/AsnC family transcriptional regulator [Actinokineospora globicatena]MCP2302228.1 DNA-binding transcriptional regulator, Lrp family [Actinokineospora globicatena]GLW76108.1 AsnC family transcriptional regulator [Actinokineospora globicatena]GLW82943.1 AsnC family transcriptional regulator [Actinokineospora globicatena]GLW95763.1 AsnC family transcriptional regulator [Actinokineospora globicatena]